MSDYCGKGTANNWRSTKFLGSIYADKEIHSPEYCITHNSHHLKPFLSPCRRINLGYNLQYSSYKSAGNECRNQWQEDAGNSPEQQLERSRIFFFDLLLEDFAVADVQFCGRLVRHRVLFWGRLG